MTNSEFKIELEERTKRFAILVFQAVDKLPYVASTRVIANQLGKSASSIGANYREANRAESHDDFIHKIAIVLKECSESNYWLDVLSGLYPKDEAISSLSNENTELLKLFASISRKAKTNRFS